MPEHLILGIDEVGRGSWAGPLVMGGCILPPHENENSNSTWISELTDSKKLSIKRREALAEIIKEKSLASATGWVSATELNEIGLAAGLRLACRRTVENIRAQKVQFHEIIIDGPTNFLAKTSVAPYVTNLNKADLLIKEVSAASIIAKVERDHYMYELASIYPSYNFEKHVGYGTVAHISAIEANGLTPEHRTFIKRLANLPTQAVTNPLKNTTTIGQKSEQVVADFLEANGHTIIARNFKTKLCEIDIVSIKSDTIYFTEVKHRKNGTHGSGLDAITPEKQKQVAFAAEVFLKFNKNYANLNPRLAVAETSGPTFQMGKWFEI